MNHTFFDTRRTKCGRHPAILRHFLGKTREGFANADNYCLHKVCHINCIMFGGPKQLSIFTRLMELSI